MNSAPVPQCSSGIDEAFRKWCYEKTTPPLGLMTPRAGAMEAFKAGIEYARTSSPTPQIAGGVRLAVVKILRSRIQASSPAEDVAPSVTNAEQVADLIFAALSQQAQAGETVLHPLSEIREWDEALAVLGIQDSDQTPADAIRERDAEIERLRCAAQRQSDRGEVVGWQARDKVRGGSWLHVPTPRNNPDFEYRPLYASPPAALPAGEAEGIQWRRVNDEPYEYAVQQGPHGDEFVKLLNGSCLCRTLVIPSTNCGCGVACQDLGKGAGCRYTHCSTELGDMK